MKLEIEEMKNTIEQKNAKIDAQKAIIHEKDDLIHHFKEDIDDHLHEIDHHKDTIISVKENHTILMIAKDTELSKIEIQMFDYAEQVKEREQEIADFKEARVKRVNKINELEA